GERGGGGDGLRWRRSRKPRVVTNAARVPLFWRMALVTTVVPCDSSPTSAGSTWWRLIATSSALSTPLARSSGVVGTLATPMRPVVSSRRATSGNVPPMSTPIRHTTCSSSDGRNTVDGRAIGRALSSTGPHVAQPIKNGNHDPHPSPPNRPFLSCRRERPGRPHPRCRGQGLHRCFERRRRVLSGALASRRAGSNARAARQPRLCPNRLLHVAGGRGAGRRSRGPRPEGHRSRFLRQRRLGGG